MRTRLGRRAALACAAGLAAALALGGLRFGPSSAEAEIDLPALAQPVVVELFTSQGCSSCPPADALLGELAAHGDVIALSWHVDYWDYIGWKDIFASPEFTARQRDYAKLLRKRYVYTPQMVIDGDTDVVGSRRGDVLAAIESAAGKRPKLALRFVDEDGGKVVIPAGEAPEGGATVWLAVYDAAQETQIKAGENAGRALREANVVREMKQLGTWTGARLELALDLEAASAAGRDGCAVIVQRGRIGPVLGAIKMPVARTAPRG